ncbi:50S ribosomal protein L6 [Candidatus Gracilibacteria bacterium]|nr:50S ribosomal protein L6 [Candidatus Gracilibacteria bacterium]
MSRIGKQPIEITSGVTVEVSGQTITVKGSKGELKREIHPMIKAEVKDNEIIVTRPDESKEARSLHGLTRTLLSNMVEGVSKGFEKHLEIIGVGYRAKPSKNSIELTLGFSHPVKYQADKDIEFVQDPNNKQIIIVKGIDKEKVGQVAAKIRSYKKPEPYKGKGIRYVGEHVARKAGKAAAKAA